ncbi:DUF6114 domain-containing protein [Actinoplanes sp. NPDC048796]|uniref:DUF6114 domain-containing protein n=1 Tax=Actinoplanes sp. NPDC048796 TaxID=3155640 RepID=UPI0033FECC3B
MGGRSSFSRWRHARPFWGGLLVTLAGAEILISVKAPLPVVVHVGMQGLAGFLVPMILLLCGILLLVSPAQRLFYSLVAAALSLGSWLTSNLGGFIVGMLLGLVGSALAFAWSPRPETTEALAPPPEPEAHPAAWPLSDEASAQGNPAEAHETLAMAPDDLGPPNDSPPSPNDDPVSPAPTPPENPSRPAGPSTTIGPRHRSAG